MTPKWAVISIEVLHFYSNHDRRVTEAFELLIARMPITKLQREILTSYVFSEAVFDTLEQQEFEEVLGELEIKV